MQKELTETLKFRYVIINYVYFNLKQKYRRSLLGFLWSVITPLLQNLIMGIVVYHLMRFPMRDYIVYLFSATVIFNIMSTVINLSPGIMINNESFIKKIYVPKLVFVLQIVFFEVINFLFILTALLILAVIFDRITITPHYLFLPVPIILAVLFLTGASIIISIWSVYFRDMQHITPVMMQAVFFLTPVLYPETLLPASLSSLIKYNPFYYFVNIFRMPIYENKIPPSGEIALCFAMSFSMLLIGLFILRKFNNKIVFKL